MMLKLNRGEKRNPGQKEAHGGNETAQNKVAPQRRTETYAKGRSGIILEAGQVGVTTSWEKSVAQVMGEGRPSSSFEN